MKRILFPAICSISLLSVLLFIMCGEVPTGNSKAPDNVHAKLSVVNQSSEIYQGDSVTIQMIVRYPDLIKKLHFKFDSTIPDTIIDNFIGSDAIYDTLFFTRKFTIAETKNPKVELELSDGSGKTFNCSFIVKAKQSLTAFEIKEISSVTSLQTETADTLCFTVETGESDIVNVFQLLNTASFKTGEIIPAAAGRDTINLVFKPSEKRVYTFYFEVSVNNKKDTLKYDISVVKGTSRFWKQDTVTINAIEGAALDFSLVPYMSDTLPANTQFITDKGVITGKVLDYTVPYGGNVRDSITIIVTQNSNAPSEIKLYLNIIMSDLSKPAVTRYFPSDSIFTTGVPSVICKFKVVDTGAGIGKVEFTVGTSVLTDTLHTDSIYQCTVSNLAHGKITAVKIKTTDKSMNKNSDSLLVYLTYDSTTADTAGPVIKLVNPSTDSARVSSSSLNVEVTCADINGIDTVKCMIGAAAVTVAKATGNLYIASVAGLSPGVNKLDFIAADNSSNKNISSKSVILIYDQAIEDNVAPVVKLKNPALNGMVVFKDSITVQILSRDDNGIASVKCTRGGVPQEVIKSADSLYSSHITHLTAGSADTVVFDVTDNSAKANKNTFAVIVKYATLKVVYVGNGNTGGLAPIDLKVYTGTSTVTVLGNTGNLEKSGYSFTGWNTVTSGTGTSYYDGNTFQMGTANVTLYAQWKINPVFYTVSYNGNGNTGGTFPIDGGLYESGTSVTIRGNTGNLEKSGCSFTGWNTAANGTGVSYHDGNTLQMGTANVTLYAQWKINPVFYTVFYHGNGNTGGTVPIDGGLYESGTSATILGNTGNLEKSGCSFTGWNTAADGSGINYVNGDTLHIGSSDISFFAKWSVNTYSILYTLNGGTNDASNPSSYTIETPEISVKALSRDGYIFDGWYYTADFSGAVIVSIPNGSTGDKTLYAGWSPALPHISTQPSEADADAGDTIKFSAAADIVSGSTLFYQWQMNSTDISGAVSSELTIKNVSKIDSGSKYRCIISTVAGVRCTSNTAALNVVYVKSVASGQYFTMILKSDGSLWAAGDNKYGQLGDGSKEDRSIPVKILNGVSAVSAGAGHAMILMNNGSLMAVGLNKDGQLGLGSKIDRSVPGEVMTGVSAVSAGANHTMILKTDGTLLATGLNIYGQLCDGSKKEINTPKEIMTGVASVEAGYNHTMILMKDGSLLGAGLNSDGQLGDSLNVNLSTPKLIMTGVSALSAGGMHTMILTDIGTLLATGSNSMGQLGDGLTEEAYRAIPITVMTGVSAVSAGGMHTIILTTDGKIFAAGHNNFGQLCTGSTENSITPKDLQISGVDAVSAGYLHTILLKSDGTAWACGNNSSGQLCDGTNVNHSSPVKIRFTH